MEWWIWTNVVYTWRVTLPLWSAIMLIGIIAMVDRTVIIIRNRVEIHLRQLVKWNNIEQVCYSFFKHLYGKPFILFNKFKVSNAVSLHKCINRHTSHFNREIWISYTCLGSGSACRIILSKARQIISMHFRKRGT